MRGDKKAWILGAAAIAAGGLSAPPAAAQEIACGAPYTVVPGDTLQEITERAYGERRNYQFTYSANRAVIGRDPALIEVGIVLNLPCLDETVASTAPTSTVTTETVETPAIVPAAARGQLRMVTGSDWAPFSNKDQEQGGMITEIINVASSLVMEPDDYKIDFINDWGAHMQPLISDVAYHFTFPWFRPNCDVKQKLSDSSQFRCNNLVWSDPVFEQIVGYYMTADAETKPALHAGLEGRTICRPDGFATFMLDEKDLVEPFITLVRPRSPLDCFEMLVDGEVDVVVVATIVADDAIARLDDPSEVEEQPQLATVATLHAVTSINNPDRVAHLALLNEGLRQTRENGRWFEIVQRHMIAHARKTSAIN